MLGSVLCGAAPDGHCLTAARLLQGAGAALFMPSSLSLLTHSFDDERERTRMLGAWSALVGVAARPAFDGRHPRAPVRLAQRLLGECAAGPAGHRHGAAAAGGTGAPAARLSLLSHALGVLALAGLSFVLIEGPVLGWLSPGVLAAGR
jgi:DHA2 family methylenomycin A resistance protein-like MFS transporter